MADHIIGRSGNLLEVNADGTLAVSGLTAGGGKALPVSQPAAASGLVTGGLTVGVAAVAIPAVPAPTRVGILVQNTGSTTLFFGNSNVVSGNLALTGPSLGPGEERFYGILSTVALYAISDAAAGFCAYAEILA